MPTVTIGVPPDTLRVNRRLGRQWVSSHADKTRYQQDVFRAWKTAGCPVMQPPWPVHLYVTLYLGKGQRCDAVDALTWCKAGLDSLTGVAGIAPDDGASYICPVTVDVGRDRERPRIELRWQEETE